MSKPEYTIQKNELSILPPNFEDVIKENNLEISKEGISHLLTDGYITIEKPDNFNISSNSPVLLSTENIAEYVFSTASLADSKIEKSIEKELNRTVDAFKLKSVFILPFISDEERQTLIDVYTGRIPAQELISQKIFNKLLNLSDNRERYISLTQLEDFFDRSYTEKKESTPVPNKIYLEENNSCYNSLLEYMNRKREILKSLEIYSGEYEELIEDIQKIIAQDSNVYSKLLNLDHKYILLYATKDNLLTISTTDTYKESTLLRDEYDITPTQQASGSVRIPVLMYHQIADIPAGSSSFVAGLYTSADEFERQVSYLAKKNYATVSSQEFLDILQSGKNPSHKSIMLTFDDGTISHYTNAYRILKKYKMKGTFFIVSHRTQISHNQLKEMADNGMDLQSHTQTHPDLVKLTDLSKMHSEIGGSKIELEARTGKSVIAIAYPGCVAGSNTYNIVASSGYKLGFSCGKSIDHRYSKNLSLSRLHNPRNIDDLKKILSGIYPF